MLPIITNQQMNTHHHLLYNNFVENYPMPLGHRINFINLSNLFFFVSYFFLPLLIIKIFSFNNKISVKMTQQKIEDTKWQLQIIFLHYSSFGDRNNFVYLKPQNYRRFLIDSETVKNQSNFVHFDILFNKIDRSAINYNQFLDMIPDLAQLTYKKCVRKTAFKQYIENNIQSLYMDILKKTEFGEDLILFMTPQVQPKTLKLIQQISSIRKIYEEYILATSMHQKQPIDTFKMLHKFLKDFQLSPLVAYKAIAYAIFLYMLKIKSDPTKFTYGDFLEYIIRVAEIGARKAVYEDQSNQIYKVIKILERMEISVGFQRLSKLITRDTCHQPTFLTYQVRQTLKKQIQQNNLATFQDSASKIWPSSTRHKNCGSFFQSNKKDHKKNQYDTVQNIMADQTMNFGKNLKDIKKTFQELCSYGEVANTKTLKSIKIKKLYEQIGILKRVTQQWVDIKLSNLTKQSLTGKVQFPQFLQLINLTSKKLNIAYETFLNSIIDHSNAKEDAKNISKISKIQSDLSQMIQMIFSAQKQLEKIFKHYSTKGQILEFDQLCKVMYEFQIFPQMVIKHRLYQIFQQYSYQARSNNQMASLTQVPFIIFEGFIDILAKVASQINQQTLTDKQKVVILLQRMHQSKGQKNVVMPKGSLVSELRSKYSYVYEQSFKKKKQIKAENFNELISSLAN